MLARDGECARRRCLRRKAGGADRTVRIDVLIGYSSVTGSGNPGTDAATAQYASVNTAGDHPTTLDAAPYDATADHTPDATNAARAPRRAREAIG